MGNAARFSGISPIRRFGRWSYGCDYSEWGTERV